MRQITPHNIKDILHYNPENGEFTWARQMGARGGVGAAAGYYNKLSYHIIQVYGKKYPAHRLAWLYMTGGWPTQHIDHINGNPSDNRFCNLRDVSQTENNQNQRRPHKQNKSGFIGVSKKGSKWQADIQVANKAVYLGVFKTPQEAHEAYMIAKRKFHVKFTL